MKQSLTEHCRASHNLFCANRVVFSIGLHHDVDSLESDMIYGLKPGSSYSIGISLTYRCVA